MPPSSSAGATSLVKIVVWRSTSSRTCVADRRGAVSAGSRPSGAAGADPGLDLLLEARRRAPGSTRRGSTQKIARNFARSRSGAAGSSASASTRALKSSHDSSRFRNRPGPCSPACRCSAARSWTNATRRAATVAASDARERSTVPAALAVLTARCHACGERVRRRVRRRVARRLAVLRAADERRPGRHPPLPAAHDGAVRDRGPGHGPGARPHQGRAAHHGRGVVPLPGAPVLRDGAVHHQAVTRGTRRVPARVRRAGAPEDLRRRAGRAASPRSSTTRASWSGPTRASRSSASSRAWWAARRRSCSS